jgi:hypothetical protein
MRAGLRMIRSLPPSNGVDELAVTDQDAEVTPLNRERS